MKDMKGVARALMRAKQAEDRARASRIEIENVLLENLDLKKSEGSEKFQFGDLEITVTSKITRTLDKAAFLALPDERQQAMARLIDWKPSLVLKEFRKVESDTLGMELAGACMTEKPAKASISVEEIIP